MNQEDIFRLLLMVLLLANRQLAPDEPTSDDSDQSFSYTMINDLLAITMASFLFSTPTENEDATSTF